ncbi:hypothetical protein [Polymorphospora lycopeni]|uniref:Uncharacterized protein n=1 Tax=Polymorphospora lycopeni TaxID=3140240 RepID=A0ABV5CW14_9ACTN
MAGEIAPHLHVDAETSKPRRIAITATDGRRHEVVEVPRRPPSPSHDLLDEMARLARRWRR